MASRRSEPSSAEPSPFHAGEQTAQARVGVRERIEQTGRRIVRDFMLDQHREFFEDLPFAIGASMGARGDLWASLLLGAPGFLRAESPHLLRIAAVPLPEDPWRENLREGAALGLLGIELPTRRRNRVNGRVMSVAAGGVELHVDQSFGNCKQYIQARAGSFVTDVAPPQLEVAQLSREAVSVLERTDTTFLATASAHPGSGGNEGLDASHRGGLPGFIRVRTEAEGVVLTLPDFSGNFMFNSFGNLEVNPRAGLLALDFAEGTVLSLTCTARVLWDSGSLGDYAGAERFLELRPQQGLLWRQVLQDWSPAEISPYLRGTGGRSSL